MFCAGTYDWQFGTPVAPQEYMDISDTARLIRSVAAELLPDDHVAVADNGEGYYTVSGVAADGRESSFAPVWIAADASESQIREKLRREFREEMQPDSAPDDLSIPGLRNEGRILHKS